MMTHIVDEILAYNAGCDPERLRLKLARMAESPFVFLRGTCHLFYPRLPDASIPDNDPPAWCCGDSHLENFGSFKGDDRQVYFDMNDFDEAALAPCTWDPVRLLVSLVLAAREIELPPSLTLDLCETFVEAYAAALADGKVRWVERGTAEGLVRELLDDLRVRKRPELLNGRTVLKHGRRSLRVDGRKALAASEEQRAAVGSLIESVTRDRPNPAFYRVLDIARRIAGTGSLGVDRYVILVEGKGSPDGNYLLDLKQALPSALNPRLTLVQPLWPSEASRVVSVQQRTQAVSPAFLQPVEFGGASYVLRGLQPAEDRISLDQARGKPSQLEALMRTLSCIVAWGQLRSSGRDGSAIADALIAFGRDMTWRRALLELAQQGAAQVERDWREYADAYKAGGVVAA
jgi:uncharacterized protein (DUF2252 family)